MAETYQNKPWLEDQYINQKQSTLEIAKKCGCTKRTILVWMKTFGIESRSRSEAQKVSTTKVRFQKGEKNPMYGKIPPKPFLKGQKPWNLGIPHTEETKEKIRAKITGTKATEETRLKLSIAHKGLFSNEKNPMWKGDDVNFRSVHEWIRERKPQPENCVLCNRKTKALELSNIDHEYKRNINDYRWLCKKCHSCYDNERFGSYKHPWNKGLPKEKQPMFGRKHTEEAKKKMSETKLTKVKEN